ncbi:zinc-ribbon domain-containing protein [Rhodopirellula halodulae]|uniref:zinc-ribbon domain-containing protein n=1 Tax=Rhodopirellula halodulae TaxID=2894198 RepID=UPI001E513FB0|nr:zinc-ribbon domain-containing protein [Rhodopirellula sp. JC737]MCC9657225.1 zinc-ribbon domain-containing protein [Rhodopirellula sp. JC737]
MSSRRIVCPRCKTTLQLPATAGATKIKCPKCELILSVPAPKQPMVLEDPSAGLPNFDALPSAQSPSNVFRPSGPVKRYEAPKPTKKKNKAAGKNALKVLGILAGIAVMCVVLIVGGLLGVGYLATRHSGWTTAKFHGYTIKMPAGEDRREKSQQFPGTTVHELAGRRRETGSQYSFVVAKLPSTISSDMNIEELVDAMRIRLKDQYPVERSGVNGVAGTMLTGFGGVEGSLCEIFTHNGNLIVTMYSPYSEIRDLVGGEREPRSNESSLDKPSEFFESLQLK